MDLTRRRFLEAAALVPVLTPSLRAEEGPKLPTRAFGKTGKAGIAAAESFTISFDQPWLSASPNSGTIGAGGSPSPVTITINPSQLPFGSSHHHFIFGATLSLSTETYYRVLCELIESLITDGFKRIFLVNGHGGNHELAELAARERRRARKPNDICLRDRTE